MQATVRPLPVSIPKPPPPPEWATWIHGRSPEVKLHKTLGHAKNALRASGPRRLSRTTVVDGKRVYETSLTHSALYRFIRDEWRVVAVFSDGEWPSEAPMFQLSANMLIDEITVLIQED